MAYAPDIVSSGTLELQRVLWGLVGIAFVSSAMGVVDAAFADRRATGTRAASAFRGVRLAPMASARGAGLSLEGLL
jgi:hypothetical protein